tara:strand:+ start:1501 stop:1821 length:321 start_codon:yes stop_codon:yes gene_type:complete
MSYINLGSSMRYGPSGKRRKTNAWTTKKKTPPPRTTMKPDQRTLDRMKAAQEHREKYPSLTSTGYTPTKYDDSYKQEVSKNYTVAIGYNKGAYQVIPNDEIKHIGK